MRQFTKWLAAVAVVASVGVAAQSASAAGPVKVFPTYPNYPTYPVPFPNPGPFPRPLPFPVPPPRIDFDYAVLYKPSFFSGVQVYGRYETLHQAQTIARRLEFKGFPTRIERYRDNGLYGW